MGKILCSVERTVFACLLFTVGVVIPAGAITLPPILFPVIINVTTSAPDVLNGADGSCSLREAITNINNHTTTFADCAPTISTAIYGLNDKIILPAGTYINAIVDVGGSENMNASGDLDIFSSVTIVGAGAASTIIDGNGMSINDRVLDIVNGFAVDAATVDISGVTIRNGSSPQGGGIRNLNILTVTSSTVSGNTVVNGDGGGILTEGPLTVVNSTINGNVVTNGNGGGIFTTLSGGPFTVTNSTISGNIASLSAGGISNNNGALTVINSTISGNTAGSDGGGIRNAATLAVINSTISGNTAFNGGGIRNWSGVAHVTNTTITGNSATGGAGGGIDVSATIILKNTIVANQTSGSDCTLGVSALNSLDSDGTCGVGTLSNQNPLLGSLQNNGGPTQTHALLPGSPAIDAGDAATCNDPLTVNNIDQRGIFRPQGTGCDIGAFELVSAPACIKSGYVPRVTVKPGTANSTIYLRTSSLANGYKTFTTTDTKLIKAAVKSLPGRTWVQIKGNADCTTATSGGAAQYVIVAP